MKSWLILLIPLLCFIVSFVMIQFHRTRLAMTAFSDLYGLTYTKPPLNPFDIGKISGVVDNADFLMETMSTKYTFGPGAAPGYPDEKAVIMRILVSGMPPNMVIHRRGKGHIGNIHTTIQKKAGLPLIKTGNDAFDKRFNVIGNNAAVNTWLTPHRQDILAGFLSKENCSVSRSSLRIELTRTFISRDDLKSAFLHMKETFDKL